MIRGDSSEYDLLKEWCETLPFYEEPKSVTTCEIGVREGLGSQVIMMATKARIGNKPYEHVGIDPYGNLEYKHFDGSPRWKINGEWSSKAPTYSDEMRDQMIKDFKDNPHFRFYNMTDDEYFKTFHLTKTKFDLVFLDGPHTTKDILKESLWFAERSRKGSRIIIDDFTLCNFKLINDVLALYDFKEFNRGENKICLQRM